MSAPREAAGREPTATSCTSRRCRSRSCPPRRGTPPTSHERAGARARPRRGCGRCDGTQEA
eukprot:569468-Pyramimonas_sp.AAC.1